MVKLNLGCGNKILFGYVNIDLRGGNNIVKADILEYLRNTPNNNVEEVILHHVIEHFSRRESKIVLKEIFRVLKPAGLLDIKCPDVYKISKSYVESRTTCSQFNSYIYGGQNYPYNYHKCGFDEKYLSEMLKKIGFGKIKRGHRYPMEVSLKALK